MVDCLAIVSSACVTNAFTVALRASQYMRLRARSAQTNATLMLPASVALLYATLAGVCPKKTDLKNLNTATLAAELQ